MSQTPREIVTRCVKFENPARIPRDLWFLPWAGEHYPKELAEIQRSFPSDMLGWVNGGYRPSPRAKGDSNAVGSYTDEWGCTFVSIHAGIMGEVRDPVVKEIGDWKKVEPPYETLPENLDAARDKVNRACAATNLFVKAGCNPRPWERYQFLRGTFDSLMDVMEPDGGMRNLLRKIHEFYLKEAEFWVSTDVDCIRFMDDWGSQQQLLIPPAVWREIFKPLYRDYCELAHSRGKLAFMHSDGNITEIFEDLVEVGVDAVNSQLFCMDIPELARRVKGKITLWGEIDRQHVLTSPDPEVARGAVRKVARHFYGPAGGVIAQCEFGPGATPQAVRAVFEEWDKISAEGGTPA